MQTVLLFHPPRPGINGFQMLLADGQEGLIPHIGDHVLFQGNALGSVVARVFVFLNAEQVRIEFSTSPPEPAGKK